MATFKEALRSALDNWNHTTTPTQTVQATQTPQATQSAQPEPTPMPTEVTQPEPTQPTPKAKLVFEYILANPGKTISEVSVALVDQGVGASTTLAYIYQLVRTKTVRRDNDKTLYALQPTYTPIYEARKIGKVPPPKPRPKPKKPKIYTIHPSPKPKTTYPIDFTPTHTTSAPPTHPTPTQAVTQPHDKLPPEQFADKMISLMSAQTASILRRKLNEMFA
jgi:hypothetical protein